jgi:hypothetical protein
VTPAGQYGRLKVDLNNGVGTAGNKPICRQVKVLRQRQPARR